MAANGWADGFDRAHFPRQGGQHALSLHPGQQHTDADMYSGTIAYMADGTAGNVIVVRAVPSARVAVGGTEEHQYLFSAGHGMRADGNVARRGAKESLHGRLDPDRLLELVAGQSRVGPQLSELVRVARQAVECGAEPGDRCVHAGSQQ